LAELLPGGGAGLHGEALVCLDQVWQRAVDVLEDGGEIVVTKAPRLGGTDQRLVDALTAEESGELDSAAHLGPDPAGTAGGRAAQPVLCARPDVEEALLGDSARPELGVLDAAAVGVAR